MNESEVEYLNKISKLGLEEIENLEKYIPWAKRFFCYTSISLLVVAFMFFHPVFAVVIGYFVYIFARSSSLLDAVEKIVKTRKLELNKKR